MARDLFQMKRVEPQNRVSNTSDSLLVFNITLYAFCTLNISIKYTKNIDIMQDLSQLIHSICAIYIHLVLILDFGLYQDRVNRNKASTYPFVNAVDYKLSKYI